MKLTILLSSLTTKKLLLQKLLRIPKFHNRFFYLTLTDSNKNFGTDVSNLIQNVRKLAVKFLYFFVSYLSANKM
jgi:hypothetical protein